MKVYLSVEYHEQITRTKTKHTILIISTAFLFLSTSISVAHEVLHVEPSQVYEYLILPGVVVFVLLSTITNGNSLY